MRKKILVTGIIIFIILTSIAYYAYSTPEIRFQVAKILGLKESPTSESSSYEINEFLVGLKGPTTIQFLGDDLVLLEKDTGKVRLVRNGIIQEKPLYDFNVHHAYESGLLGILSFDSKVFIYLTESKEDGGPAIADNIYRFDWNGQELTNKYLVNSFNVTSSSHHGGAMVNDQDGNIFLIRGDQRDWAYKKYGILQNSDDAGIDDAGVIIRVGLDENVKRPSESPKPLEHYFAIGIRNSFGMDIDPITGYLWDTENGPEDFDEINLVFPKFNSGWNKIMGPSNKTNIESLPTIDGFVYSEPEFSWQDPVAPTALLIMDPVWNKNYGDSVFVGACNGKLYNFILNSTRTGFEFQSSDLKDLVLNKNDDDKEITFIDNMGCITDIEAGPDGFLYIASFANNGAIYKIKLN